MELNQKLERAYLISSVMFIVFSTIYITIHDILLGFYQHLVVTFLIFLLFLGFTSLRLFLSHKKMIRRKWMLLVSKGIDVIIVLTGTTYMGMGEWIYSLILLILIYTSITMGRKAGYILISFFLPTHGVFFLVNHFSEISHGKSLLSLIKGDGIENLFFILCIYFLAIFLCGLVYNLNQERQRENHLLLQQLGEKYEQLEVAQEEIKNHNNKLRDTNIRLEETNKKLTSSIAEFYTLQQISQAISSILEIKELLKYVNDIILGVMGVNYSTIILYDEKRMKLKVHTTNLKNREDLITLSDNINHPILLNALNQSKSVIENFVDDDEYIFTKDRDVNSLILVPLNTKSRKYGLVLIEHKYYSAFDEENVRLLETIGQQVGIAMENAELYQKMQELASIDGLTGVYNRLFFQERLFKEFKSAQEESYSLALAIFDIDHFKKFNDTYGHLFGDQVLKTIATVVNKSLRNSDIFARFGGEEFIILLPRTNIKEAFDKIEILRQKIASTTIKDNLVTVSVTVSFGIAAFPESAYTENDLIRLADDALYQAKAAGRNCIRIADPKED